MHRKFTSSAQIAIRRLRRLALPLCSLIVMLGLLSLGASQVEASCGDYLGHYDVQNGMRSSGAEGGHVDSQPLENTPDRQRCHGPFCQKNSIPLPSHTPVVVAEPQDRCLWSAISSLPSGGRDSFLVPASEPDALPTIAVRLDRPPKA